MWEYPLSKLLSITLQLYVSLHAEKSFQNLIIINLKSDSIYHFSIDSEINQKMVNIIWFQVDYNKISKIFLYVRTHRSRLLSSVKLTEIWFYLPFFRQIYNQTEFNFFSNQSENSTHNQISVNIQRIKSLVLCVHILSSVIYTFINNLFYYDKEWYIVLQFLVK